ncbi:hypothetical protein RF11_14908 [Thelohanellus kitauei]|uniref:Uncharacterized protein n=1 Tax=Thelohanellus kitauei TaxID=669202 RepID=A0A0C2MWH3_THEKT|nr:hypothetical protein RF11_14908 [Thelohanellus kitauei]
MSLYFNSQDYQYLSFESGVGKHRIIELRDTGFCKLADKNLCRKVAFLLTKIKTVSKILMRMLRKMIQIRIIFIRTRLYSTLTVYLELFEADSRFIRSFPGTYLPSFILIMVAKLINNPDYDVEKRVSKYLLNEKGILLILKINYDDENLTIFYVKQPYVVIKTHKDYFNSAWTTVHKNEMVVPDEASKQIKKKQPFLIQIIRRFYTALYYERDIHVKNFVSIKLYPDFEPNILEYVKLKLNSIP